jgi:hypothetical protein
MPHEVRQYEMPLWTLLVAGVLYIIKGGARPIRINTYCARHQGMPDDVLSQPAEDRSMFCDVGQNKG